MPCKVIDINPAPPKPGLTPLDGYVRVSRVGGRSGESYIAPEEQEKTILAHCPRGYYIAKVFREEDESGANDQRDGWLEARRRVLAQESGGIVVVRIDRFARNALNAIEAAEEIVDAGGRFISCYEQIDVSTPEGKYVFTQFAAIAELEHARLKRGWHQAVTNATARGVYVSGVPPTGYTRKPFEPEKGKLIPNELAPAIEEIFRRRAPKSATPKKGDKGDSWTAISDYLNTTERRLHWTPNSARHLLHRTDDAKLKAEIEARLNGETKWQNAADYLMTTPLRPAWTPQTVMRIVHNPVYKGEINYGSRTKRQNGRKPEFDIKIENTHEAIVSAELWQRANDADGGHTPKDGSLTAQVATKGIAVCDACGLRLQVTATVPIYGVEKGQRIPVLYCKGRSGGGACPAPSAVKASLLDRYVSQLVKARLREYGRAPAVEVRAAEARFKAATLALEDARNELAKWQTPKMRAAMDEAAFLAGLDELREAVTAAEQDYTEAREAAGLYQKSGGHVLELWHTFTPAELRIILAGYVREVRLGKAKRRTRGHLPLEERVTIQWR